MPLRVSANYALFWARLGMDEHKKAQIYWASLIFGDGLGQSETSFNILDLFSNLFYQYFQLDCNLGHFLIGRFGTQGIGFAVQFLH